jgi:hypothetical protein
MQGTRCSRGTGSAAPNGRGPSRNQSRGANGRGGRTECTARLQVRCARDAAAAAAGLAADSVAWVLTWQPPRAYWICDPPDDRQHHHRRRDRPGSLLTLIILLAGGDEHQDVEVPSVVGSAASVRAACSIERQTHAS